MDTLSDSHFSHELRKASDAQLALVFERAEALQDEVPDDFNTWMSFVRYLATPENVNALFERPRRETWYSVMALNTLLNAMLPGGIRCRGYALKLDNPYLQETVRLSVTIRAKSKVRLLSRARAYV